MNAIDELKKLKELLNEGTINQAEFNILKKGILNNTEINKSEYTPYISKAKQETQLKNTDQRKEPSTTVEMICDSHKDGKYSLINKRISNKTYKDSSIEKDTYAKIITFITYALILIFSIVGGIISKSFSLVIILLIGLAIAYYITYKILKRSYTKLTTAITLIIIPLLLNLSFLNTSISSSNCENGREVYQLGYSSGRTVMLTGESCSCESYIDSFNKQTGRHSLFESDCFCEGFNDGLDGKPSKF